MSTCGGDGGSSEGANNSGSSTDTSTPSQPQYSEPTKDVVDANALGFYDYDAMSSTRAIRSVLTGSFQGMVQFAQAQVVDSNSSTNGANHKWSMLTPNTNLILSYLKPKNLAVLANEKFRSFTFVEGHI